MFSIHERPTRLCDGLNRREIMRVGSLGLGGLALPELLQARDSNAIEPVSDRDFGRAKNVIYLYLQGGPPQHETFDPKPNAPEGIRGPFNPISTTIPGMQFCELLPRMAKLADKMAVVRSMATDDNIHSSSSSWVLTGYKYRGPNARTISPTDWPYFGSIIKKLKPSERLPALTSVWLPDIMRLNENVTPAGQTGGFLGTQWNPEVFVGDPSEPSYEIESLRETDIAPLQMTRRQSLLSQLEQRFARLDRSVEVYDTFQQQAFDLLTSGRARQAFDVSREPDEVRDRYGRNRWGQCVLLARRLIEAGVRLVHVQWPREPGDNAVDNPLWDTHAQNADRVEDVLCPMLDVGYSALIEDLDQRGLLEETLVVAIGEFGRTPKINPKGGRDHWGPVFSFALAGAGISGGQVYGSSDRNGAYPASDRVQPENLTATIFHLMGVNHQGSFPDRQGREHRLTTGDPLWKLLGSEPATPDRIASNGSVERVPAYDPTRHLLHVNFNDPDSVRHVTAASRPKGWRTDIVLKDDTSGFGLKLIPTDKGWHAALGFQLEGSERSLEIPVGAKAFVSQEVRSPFAGSYRFRVRARAIASNPERFEPIFRKHFDCRLVFFQFNNQQKKITDHRELASISFVPEIGRDGTADWQSFELSKLLMNPRGNFSFGAGMGVSIQLARRTSGPLSIAGAEPAFVFLEIADVTLEFQGKQVKENVTV